MENVGARRRPPLWVMVAVGSVIASLSLGVRSTFGLYLDPIAETLGTGRGTFALTVAIQQIIWGLGQPVTGAISDRFGSGRVLVGGGVLFTISLLLMGRSTNALAIHATGGFLFGLAISAASFAVVLAAVGRAAPPAKRSMALGIVSALGSIGQFVLVPIAQRLVDSVGWEETVIVLGAFGALIIIAVPPLRGSSAEQQYVDPDAAGDAIAPETPRPLRDELRRASKSKSFLLLNAAFFVCGFHVTSIATHLPSYVGDLGLSTTIGANALALIGLFNVFGSLAAGALGGRYSKTGLLAGIYGLRAVVIAWYVIFPASGTTTIVFGVLMGMLWLATVPLTSAIVAQQFGTQHAGALFGIVFLSHQVGAFLGAWGGGMLADSFESYRPVWWIGVGLAIGATLAHVVLDDGPVPEPPPPAAGSLGLPVLPAGGAAAIVVVVSLLPLVAPTGDRADGALADPPPAYCILHPVIVES